MNMTSSPSRALLSFSDAAKAHLKTLFQTAPTAQALKIGLKNAGCAGMSYTMDFVDNIAPQDEVVLCDDMKIVIEMKSLLFLIGMHLDYKQEKLRSGFVFVNPNQTDACGCGESVKLVPAAVSGESDS